MLWLCAALLHASLLFAAPALVRLSLAPLPRETAAVAETGVVVVTGRIEADGGMNQLELSQGPAIFIEPSLDSIRQWQFERAAIGDVAVPATAVFLYRAQTDLPNSPHRFSIALNDTGCNPGAPMPTTIVDPEYPLDSVAEGTVVLQLTIDKAGRTVNADVINGVPSLTQAAIDAVSQWKFSPADQEGAGVAVAVITFRRPAHTY
jgi:TonB family protein